MVHTRSGWVHGLVGQSAPIAAVRRLIDKASRNHLPVLLLGESGTGKEVVARGIHHAAPRGAFVPIDCGSLVGTLMESELFGHVKGAFSGAAESKRGLVELADGGTAFFDEIGDLPLEMQVKLLRLLQEGEFRAVGSLQWKKIDLRIIAATHRNLQAEVAAGRFRLDLYYRLNVFCIRLPALRERREDIPLLARYFAGAGEHAGMGTDHMLADQLPADHMPADHVPSDRGLPAMELSQELIDTLVSYEWPGNVRELKNCIERVSALRSEGALMQICDLPSALQNHCASTFLQRLSGAVDLAGRRALPGFPVAEADANLPDFHLSSPSPVISLPDSERRTIALALASTGGERGRTAHLLGIGRTTLYRKMKQYGIE